MNKFLILAFSLASITSTTVYAQHTQDYLDEDYNFEQIETDKSLNLSSTQVSKLKSINQGLGQKFAQIGRDRSLSGYEKGMKKRELALKHKQEVYKILNAEQQQKWNKYGHRDSIKDDITDRIDDQIDALEDRYKAEKKAVEKNDHLSKIDKKAKKKELEYKFKREKEILKAKKDKVKNHALLRE